MHKVFSKAEKAEEKGWKKVKLDNISEVSAGGTPKRSVKKYYGGNIPWVKISDIPDNGMVYETEERLTKHGLENSSTKVFPKGTILFTIFATIGKVGVLKIDAATNQAIAGIQIKNIDVVNRDYLFYCLRNIGTSLAEVGRGMAQDNINQTILKNVEIPLPAIEKQKKIVTYLNEIREITESLRTLQGKIDENVKGLAPAILDKAFRGEL